MDFAPCPKCGAFNAPDTAACVECRSPLDAEPDAASAPIALKAEPEPEPEPPPEAEPEAAPQAAFDAPPEVLAKVAKLEADIAQKPQARSLYLQLAQVYVDAKRSDLAAEVLERGLALDPANVYFRHKLAQVTGHPEPRAPLTERLDARPAAPGPGSRRAAAPARGRGLPRGRVIALVAALAAVAIGVKLVVFPSTRRLVAGDFRAYAPVWSPTGKHIAFVIDDARGSHLAVFDFASGAHRVAADLPMPEADAFSWSPDGKRIAYTGPGAENEWMGAIHVFDVASGQSKPLAPGSSPRWRADGSLLAVCGPQRPAAFDGDFEGSDGGGGSYDFESRFCRIDADSGAVTRTALAVDYGMALSPLLDRVVFERSSETSMADAAAGAGAGGDGEFQAMADAVVAGKARNVAEGARDLNRELEARKYMEKRKAARGAGRVPEVEVFAADVDRGEPVRLFAAGEAAYPSWTAGGDRILFAANGASGVEFWTTRDDGGDRRPVLTGVKVADPSSVRLSPDGKHVFFVAPVEGDPGVARLMTGEEPADLHVAPVGGGEARRLSNKHSFKHRYAVSPDGKRIAYEVLQDVKMLGGPGKSEIWLMNR